MTTTRNAPISWAQRDNLIMLTVELDTVKVEELKITPTSFKFKGATPDATYESSFDFFEEVKEEDIKKGVNTRYIELVINKKESAWWPRLLKDKAKVHWLKVDFGKWKEEDDSDDGGDNLGNFGNFDLSQYTNQLGGGEAPDLGDFDDEDGDEMPELEDDEEDEAGKKENGKEGAEQ